MQDIDGQDDAEALPEQLDLHALRVLAVLGEKEVLTPDVYPMSVNALVSGCNQITSRDPVLSMTESDVRLALDELIAARLVAEVSQAGARVSKYEHRMRIKWHLEQDKLAVLILLMLRGGQTAGELRTRSGRLHDFASVADVEQCLQFLMDKFPPFVQALPRQPGTKEVRYAHLFSGVAQVEAGAGSAIAVAGRGHDRIAALEQEVETLRAELSTLRERFDALLAQLQ